MTLVAERRPAPRGAPTYFLIHGIGMGRTVFADLVAHLGAQADVVAVDLPGYGEAPEPPRTPTIERIADLVGAYARTLGAPVILLGHSMGSQVATEVAVRHPDVASALILAAPTVDRRHRSALTQLWRLVRDLLGESVRVLAVGGREYLRAGPRLSSKMRAMLHHRPERSYPRVGVPTLVIRGERDRVCPPAWCDEVTAAIPGATQVAIPGHGHETLIRDAAPAAREITRFLAGAGVIPRAGR